LGEEKCKYDMTWVSKT